MYIFRVYAINVINAINVKIFDFRLESKIIAKVGLKVVLIHLN